MSTSAQLATSAATAVVQAMSTDGYRGLRDRLERFFKRHSADPAAEVARLDDFRVLARQAQGSREAHASLVRFVAAQLESTAKGDTEVLRALLAELVSGLGSTVVDSQAGARVAVHHNVAFGNQNNAGRDINIRTSE